MVYYLDLDSDTLYMLATGVSILSIVAVFVFKLFIGGKKEEQERVDENKPIGVRGRFGQLPMAEWKQHKMALEQEYKDNFTEHSTDEKRTNNESDDSENTVSIDSGSGGGGGEKASRSRSKVVRFQGTDDDAGQPREMEPYQDGGDDDTNSEDSSMEGPLHEKILDESVLEHLPAHLKSAKLRTYTKEVEKDLTDEQKQEEAQVRCQQLESIFNLMREQEEKFGVSSMNDIEEQLKLYSI